MVIKAFNESGEEIDGSAHLAGIESSRKAKFGCVNETLWKRLEHLADNDTVDVVILPNLGELATELARIEVGSVKQPEEERRVWQKVEEQVCAVASELRNLGIHIKEAPYFLHFIHASMSPGQVRHVSRMESIGFVLFDDHSEVTDLGNLIAVSHADRAHALGLTGTGVNIAVFESGPRTTAADLPIRSRYSAAPPPVSNGNDEHGRLAAGNFSPNNTPPSTASEFVNGKGYNTIVVGNHNDAATAMSSSSVYRNPRSLDRELPHLTANGEGVTAVAPIETYPGAHGGRTSRSLNAEAAVLIVQTRAIKDRPPRNHAWDGGENFFRGNFGPDKISKFRYRIQVPPATTTGRFTVKVAFTWDSVVPANATGPVIPGISYLNRRYDLLVLDDRGVQVANSSSFDNNYEIAEFTGLPSQEYAIVLRPRTVMMQFSLQ
ncbi:uncharacterized protein CDV56_108585 [Aspergillus thermomutatus]|uniref:Uncharacterized protein n=1 Tax=Aspergillus thermomutatus TaxID=41047 RepID=A0A397HKW6_ASPTH|nr:uncharacterized protein CDV56_108585 [Aspergillus thermomutatus]RHZ63617.1 hypothetical protein CDV56_108585 [Aspergillus thermomutatus]